MSQIVRIRKTHMVEREYLIGALEDLEYDWQEDARIGLFGPKADIKIRGANIGFRKTDLAYEMIMQGRSAVRQANLLQKLTQRYAYHAARAKLEAQGFSLASEEVQQDGHIRLVLRRMV